MWQDTRFLRGKLRELESELDHEEDHVSINVRGRARVFYIAPTLACFTHKSSSFKRAKGFFFRSRPFET